MSEPLLHTILQISRWHEIRQNPLTDAVVLIELCLRSKILENRLIQSAIRRDTGRCRRQAGRLIAARGGIVIPLLFALLGRIDIHRIQIMQLAS